MRIFKTKAFTRWMRKEGLKDAGLLKANIDVPELRALKLMAKTLLVKSNTKLKKDLEASVIVEVQHDG